jgi:hypothetical protein
MKFTETSKQYSILFFEKFKKMMLKKGNNEITFEKKIFKQFFTDIIKADNYITSNILKNISYTINKIDNSNDIKYPNIYNTPVFSGGFREHINNNTNYEILYKCHLLNKFYKFYFYIDNHNININEFNQCVKYMLLWLFILNTYDKNICSSNLTIFLYFTNKNKLLPNSNIIVLDKQHVNTAYTVDCIKKSEIVIYRKEEWFKVFLHETMHNFSFDFSSMNLHIFDKQMISLFPIHIEFNVFESYCEMWARIINIMFCSYNSLNASTDNMGNIIHEINEKNRLNSLFNHFYLYSEVLLQIERIFSFYQCNKVLKFMGLTYENLYNNDETSIMLRKQLYRENTNVFSYYILTALFFNNYIDFIKWCYNNNTNHTHTHDNNKFIKFNRTSENLNQYFSLIKKKYNDKKFIQNLNNIQLILNKNKNDFSILNDSLRMTLFELNID